MTVRIQCPACQRQFKVSEELKGRTVECGACEKQFVVDGDAIVPERDRYFPGDHKKPGLEHYGRPASQGRPVPAVRFATATYDTHASAADVTPPSPQRMVATSLGILLQILFAVILLFGSQENGMLKDMMLEKRIVLSVFVAIVGAALILYGSYRRKRETFILAPGLAILVVGLAYFLPVPKTLDLAAGAGAPSAGSPQADPDPDPVPVSTKMTELEAKEAMGYGPVAKAAANFSDATAVVALWAPEMKARFKYQILRYLHRKTGTGERPSFYTRGTGGLIVIEGTKLGLAEIEAVVERFAHVDDVYPNLRVLKITIEGERLLEPSPELERKLNDTSHPSFYAYNQAELDHINIDRVREAAQRLSMVEPKRFRTEIAQRLVELLQEDADSDFRSTICNAIMVWSEPGDGSEQAVAKVAQDLLLTDSQVPRSMIQFLTARKAPEVVSILEILWKGDPGTWEPLVVDLQSDAEGMIVSYLNDEDAGRQRSAIIIMRRVGTKASLPALRLALQSTNEEMKVLMQSAIDAIESK